MAGKREGNGNRNVTVEELLLEMHRTVDGLAEDGAGRADLKLLSRSLRELRHAFRFFDGLRDLAGDFRDLLAEGGMTQTAALPEEAEEPEIAGLPRIVFRFNNRSFGRLRQLIDRLNEESAR